MKLSGNEKRGRGVDEHIYAMAVTIAEMGNRPSRFEGSERDNASPALCDAGSGRFWGL